MTTVHQLRIAWKWIEPPIWRRFQVLSTSTLEQLHYVIQKGGEKGC